MTEVRHPAMRREAEGALASLADLDHQRRVWIGGEVETPGSRDDLDLVVHTLYDDTGLLESPELLIGTILVSDREVEALKRLASAFDRLIDRLGDAADAEYVAAPEWPEVVRLAGVALARMVRHDDGV